MELFTGSILSVKGLLAIIGILLASVTGYAAVADDTPIEEGNFLVQNTNVDSDFRDDVLSRVSRVNGTVTNTLNGDVEISKAESVISYEIAFSKDQTDISPEDMQTNKAYMVYLGACSDVIDAYMYEYPDLKDKIDAMNEKKNLI